MLKNPPANAGDMRSKRSPGEGNDNPLQYSCLEIPRTEERGGLQSMGPQKSGTVLSDWAHTGDWLTPHHLTCLG